MSKHHSRASAGHDRAGLYEEITGKIIVELEAGRVPWVQPWGSAAVKAHLAIPKNACRARHYSGSWGHLPTSRGVGRSRQSAA